MRNDLFILTLLNLPRIGKKTVIYILNNYSVYSIDENDILDMLKKMNTKNKKIKVASIDEIIAAKEKADKILDETYKLNIGVMTILDKDFPSKLKEISDPPVILFYRGNKGCLYEDNSVAIIGSRKPTPNGIKAAQRLGYLFAEDGFVVVSGLAKGCDENGHIGCLSANGKTVAVLPCGLNYIYPASNKKLAEEVLKKDGCVITEYPIGVKVFKTYFVERDRLESALSRAVIVVETSVQSGTMHTVEFSKEQKKILAVYKPNDKYIDCDKVQGNKLLMRDKDTVVLDSPESIEKLKRLIINKKEENEINKQLKFM